MAEQRSLQNWEPFEVVTLKRRKIRLAGTKPVLLPRNSTTSSLTCEQVNRKFCLLFSSFLFLLPFSYESKKYPLEYSALSQTTILHLIRHPPEYTWRQTICWSFSFSCASHHHFSINMVFSAQDTGILRWNISSSDSDVHGRSILHIVPETLRPIGLIEAFHVFNFSKKVPHSIQTHWTWKKKFA